MPFRSEAQRKYLHMMAPDVAAEMEQKMKPGTKLPKHVGDDPPTEEEEMPGTGKMAIPGPDEIDAALDATAKEADMLKGKMGKMDERVGEEAMEEKKEGAPDAKTLRMLTTYGPPEEWAPSDMKLLGKDNCVMLKGAWDKMPEDQKAMVLRVYEGKEHAASFGGDKEKAATAAMPMAAVTIATKEM